MTPFLSIALMQVLNGVSLLKKEIYIKMNEFLKKIVLSVQKVC